MKQLFGMLMVLASTVLACGADAGKDNAAREELKKFAGTWALVSLEVDGKTAPADDIKDTRVVIKGNKATFSHRDKVVAETIFSLDPMKKPKTMDATSTLGPNKGQKTLAIYELDGDNLKVCSTQGEQRPKEFAANQGSGCSLYVWKRMKD